MSDLKSNEIADRPKAWTDGFLNVFGLVLFAGFLTQCTVTGLDFPPQRLPGVAFYAGTAALVLWLSVFAEWRRVQAPVTPVKRTRPLLRLIALTMIAVFTVELVRGIFEPLVEYSTTPRDAIGSAINLSNPARTYLGIHCAEHGTFDGAREALRASTPESRSFDRSWEEAHIRVEPFRLIDARSAVFELMVTRSLGDPTSRGPVRWAWELFAGNLDIKRGQTIVLNVHCRLVDVSSFEVDWTVSGTASRRHLSRLSAYLTRK